MERYKIREMKNEDWEQVVNIYKEGIETGIATFQTEVPDYESWDKGHLKKGRFVACNGDTILGWIAMSPTSSRCVYSGVVEVSVYIGKNSRHNGIGEKLMTKLIEYTEENNIWSLYSAIIRKNVSSIELHKKCGFREVGIRERIAKLSNGEWSDTVIMEYRSKKVGID